MVKVLRCLFYLRKTTEFVEKIHEFVFKKKVLRVSSVNFHDKPDIHEKNSTNRRRLQTQATTAASVQTM